MPESWKVVEHEGDFDIDCSLEAWNCPQELGKEIRGIRDQSKNRGHPNHGTV